MKVLWITNIVFPEANMLMGNQSNFKETGGWMLGAAKALTANPEIELSVASLSSEARHLLILNGEKIKYYVIPKGRGNHFYNRDYEVYWGQIYNDFHPNVIHIHGTEYTHGLAYVNTCSAENVVVSIQGMKSVYCNYYCYGLSIGDIVRNLTLHDLLTGGLLREKKIFYRTGKYEKELLARVNHVIGRTSWDRAHTWAINPNVNYYHCNETLRDVFYQGAKWEYEKCSKHSIFISQATYPIKGLHQILKALPLIFRHYPDTTVRIAGKDVRKYKGLSGYLHYSGYGKYVRKKVKELGLEDRIEFVGNLDASGMLNEYIRCNIFICPSSIENSPNSLGEAQILGTPCIASYVGGIPDMMEGEERYMYRFEEIEMLAYKVCDVFSCGNKISNSSSIKALDRHSPEKNGHDLMSIYRSIQESNKN